MEITSPSSIERFCAVDINFYGLERDSKTDPAWIVTGDRQYSAVIELGSLNYAGTPRRSRISLLQ
jgi:hypothetical protein